MKVIVFEGEGKLEMIRFVFDKDDSRINYYLRGSHKFRQVIGDRSWGSLKIFGDMGVEKEVEDIKDRNFILDPSPLSPIEKSFGVLKRYIEVVVEEELRSTLMDYLGTEDHEEYQSLIKFVENSDTSFLKRFFKTTKVTLLTLLGELQEEDLVSLIKGKVCD